MRRKLTALSVVASILIVVWALFSMLERPSVSTVVHPRLDLTGTAPSQPQNQAPAVPVMTVGSSIAAGWDDTQGGYLARAFRSLSARTNVPYHIISWAVPGMTTTQAAPHFARWLNYVHPKIVVISWGGLDDSTEHTSVADFVAAVDKEIALALKIDAVVFIVTPPVTAATYEAGTTGLPYQYFMSEMNAAKSLHNPNVYVFDVFDQMMATLAANHQTYIPYSADNWHPNVLGHTLAGNLLYQDLAAQFKQAPIQFVP